MSLDLSGRLLVAAPSLVQVEFFRTVVLIVEHNDEGAAGLVLNRPSDTDTVDVLPLWGPLVSMPSVVFVGGPVGPGSAIGLGRTHEGAGWDVVDLSLAPHEIGAVEEVRVFTGFAGWGPGQLESELDEKAWFVVDADASDVFSREPDELWRGVLKRQVGSLRLYADYPLSPSLN